MLKKKKSHLKDFPANQIFAQASDFSVLMCKQNISVSGHFKTHLRHRGKEGKKGLEKN